MPILQIEHEVLNFEGWKKAFKNDPIDRKKAGVRNYKIFQRNDNPNFVVIDLEFDNLKQAEDALFALRTLWQKIEGKIMINPQIRILNLVESVDI
jgi:L-rhamnose mutarotase